jgi:uncharacterized repeat protein (TIGR01451 family)
MISLLTPALVPIFTVEAQAAPEIILRGKDTAFNITQTGAPPWKTYERGTRPVIMVAQRVGEGAAVAAGTVPTCRNGRWNDDENPNPHFDKLLDVMFQWMVPGALRVLWYEGYNVYNDTAQCSDIVEALDALGYVVVGASTMPITLSLLEGYDILVIPQLQLGDRYTGGDPDLLPDADVQAIKEFVEGGGGLLIMEGSDFLGYHFSKVQNKILLALGFEYGFQDDQMSEDVNAWDDPYEPTVDVDVTTEIGAAYQDATGKTEIGLYSICTLAVMEQGVSVIVLPDYQTGTPGSTLEYTVMVMNPENPAAEEWTYDITVEGTAGWGPTVSPTSVTVPVGENKQTTLRITIPADTPMSTESTLVVTAVARGLPDVSDDFTTLAHAGLRLEPIDDAYVTDEDNFANFGDRYYLNIGRYYEFWQFAYLKFDLAEIPENAVITDAKLYLYCYRVYGPPPEIAACEVEDDTWMDLTITWANKPENGPALDVIAVGVGERLSPKSYSWDVTPFVQEQFAGDKVVSLCVRPPDTLPPSVNRSFESREWPVSLVRPFLRVSYTEALVSITPTRQDGLPGETLTYTVTVTNIRDVADTFELSVSDVEGWSLSISPTSISLGVGESGTAELNVTIPEDAVPSTEDEITVTATSAGGEVSETASCVAHVLEEVARGVEVDVSPSAGSTAPGGKLTYTVTITNTGEATDTFTLQVEDVKGWSLNISPTSISLEAGESGTAELSVTIPKDAVEGDITTVTVTAAGADYGGSDACTAEVKVAVFPTIYIAAVIVVLVVIVGAVLMIKRK